MLNKTKQKFNFSVTVAIVVGIIIVVNFFSYQIFYRLDLTQNKEFSISKVSKKTAGALKDIVTIKAYFSKNLPSQYINVRQEVGDILDEYQNYSNGNIRIEFIDPADSADMERELYMQGIPSLQFNVMEKDKYQVVKGYMGMVISFGDKKQAIPVIQDTNSLEYQITTAIKKVTSKEIAKIGLMSGYGCSTVETELASAYKKLQELYEVQVVDVKKEKEIPTALMTLIIPGPKDKIDDSSLKKINTYVMQGGKLLVLLDGVKVGEGLSASVNDTNLNTLLEKYGLRVNKDLVLDVQNGMASFNQGYVTFSTNYPYWPKVSKDGLNKDNAAVSSLESILFPWVSSVEILRDKIDSQSKAVYLANTTNKAQHVTENFNITPQMGQMPNSERKQFALAAMVNGTLKSAFPNEKNIAKQSENSRVIVVGDSDFPNDNFIRNTPDNLIFFQNLVDSLSLDEDLITIRSKGITERPIQELSDGAKVAIRYANVLGITLIVVCIGLIRYFIRKKKRFIEEF
jgi:gliding-associated putative ABC transporter substrate-binding component GldG